MARLLKKYEFTVPDPARFVNRAAGLASPKRKNRGPALQPVPCSLVAFARSACASLPSAGRSGARFSRRELVLAGGTLDLTAVVSTALGTHSMGQAHRAALGAGDQTGRLQLPHGAAPLITSRLRNFTLGDCHDDTSYISEFCLSLRNRYPSSEGWPAPPTGGLLPSDRCSSLG